MMVSIYCKILNNHEALKKEHDKDIQVICKMDNTKGTLLSLDKIGSTEHYPVGNMEWLLNDLEVIYLQLGIKMRIFLILYCIY